MIKKALVFVIVFFVILGLIKLNSLSPYYYKETRLVMGTIAEVIVPDKSSAELVFTKLIELERILSAKDPNSEVSKLNKFGTLKVSQDTLNVVKLAKKYYNLTEGCFDITVLPLLEIWGFAINKIDKVPSQENIDKALSLLGSDKIEIDEQNFIIRFKQPRMMIDLGGIAKGYAVDQAIMVLKSKGVKSALIKLGGEIFCLGKKGNSPWLVGIKDPRKSGVAQEVSLENEAISTSGDYERFIEISGVRYPHVLDPRKGKPVDNGVVAVSTIADSAVVADVMATALFVAGKEKAVALSEKAGLKKFEILEEEDIK